MEFRIVTPTRNSDQTIERTIISVLSQDYRGEINYHIQDCLSTDSTLAIANKWAQEVNTNGNPLGPANIRISISSQGDKGMYDAISKGFEAIDAKSNANDAWLSWINSDDYFARYAFSTIAKVSKSSPSTQWITGSAAVVNDSVPVSIYNRELSSQVIKEGLADGIHTDFVQQEGTFFKLSLYNSADKANAFGGLKYAGDWNLWRMLAYRSELVQVKGVPLAFFVISENQLSRTQREKYIEEIDFKVPASKRNESAGKLIDQFVPVYTADFHWQTAETKIHKRTTIPKISLNALRKGLPEPDINDHNPRPLDTSEFITGFDKNSQNKNCFIFPSKWQYPAVTEKRAAEIVQKSLNGFDHVIYIGMPWATIIDLLNAGKEEEARTLVNEAKVFSDSISKSRKRIVTVCQHIHASKYSYIFTEIGVTDLFWSHATKTTTCRDFKVHSFPLFAVNYSSAWKRWHNRTYNANFVGAKAENWYLTNTRNEIIEHIRSDEHYVVTGNPSWFFHDTVYKKQISQSDQELDTKEMISKSQSYTYLLGESIFTICPSGTGPNTIRLWEAICSGSIPIILSDSWKSPGFPSLWAKACISLPDTLEGVLSIKPTIDQLLANPEKIAGMQNQLKELMLLYGPDTFVTDILELAQRHECIMKSIPVSY